MVTMTHEQELNLERFANLMVELIERHADAVDKEEMEKRLSKLNNGAGNEKFPASFIIWGNVCKWYFKYDFIEIFRKKY